MFNVTFQTFILLMSTIVTKAKILKNQNVDISTTYNIREFVNSRIAYKKGTLHYRSKSIYLSI